MLRPSRHRTTPGTCRRTHGARGAGNGRPRTRRTGRRACRALPIPVGEATCRTDRRYPPTGGSPPRAVARCARCLGRVPDSIGWSRLKGNRRSDRTRAEGASGRRVPPGSHRRWRPGATSPRQASGSHVAAGSPPGWRPPGRRSRGCWGIRSSFPPPGRRQPRGGSAPSADRFVWANTAASRGSWHNAGRRPPGCPTQGSRYPSHSSPVASTPHRPARSSRCWATWRAWSGVRPTTRSSPRRCGQ